METSRKQLTSAPELDLKTLIGDRDALTVNVDLFYAEHCAQAGDAALSMERFRRKFFAHQRHLAKEQRQLAAKTESTAPPTGDTGDGEPNTSDSDT